MTLYFSSEGDFATCFIKLVVLLSLAGASILAFSWQRKKRKQKCDKKYLRVAFLHPDLGIGGAERLVLDAAIGLINSGHRVVVYTAHHDANRCFAETKDGSLHVVVAGDWLPRHIRGKGHVLFATLRMIWLTLWCAFRAPSADVYIVDQVSAPLVFIKHLICAPSLFYCHFPDKLCDPTLADEKKRGALRKLYRAVFDTIEEWCLLSASRIVFNSQFTKETTLRTFTTLKKATNDILYPPINTRGLDTCPVLNASDERIKELTGKVILLSINRFELKKNVKLALLSFVELIRKVKEENLKISCKESDLVLVLAGGYDERLPNNVECLKELKEEASQCGYSSQIKFMTSISEYEKYQLLHHANLLMYTPTGEHFGIVPLEAMYCGVPVIAVNSAGPLESVVDGKTGMLREPTVEGFTSAIVELLSKPRLRAEMSPTATKHVKEKFSLAAFISSLEKNLFDLVQ